MAEKDQDHLHELEKLALRGDQLRATLGLCKPAGKVTPIGIFRDPGVGKRMDPGAARKRPPFSASKRSPLTLHGS